MSPYLSDCAAQLASLSRALAELALAAWELEKAGYRQDQSRWPKGTPGAPKPGGRWSPGDPGDAGGSGDITVHPKAKPKPPPNGVGRRAVSSAAKAAVRRLVRAALVAADITAPEVMAGLEIGAELAQAALPHIQAYFDPPQSLDALNTAVDDPQTGYDIHHIVEQATVAADGSEDEAIDSPDNLVRIPTLKHWELNAWYQKGSLAFSNQSPRDYLQDKSWNERRRVGLLGLQAVGVLK
jgi:hypothetical protein